MTKSKTPAPKTAATPTKPAARAAQPGRTVSRPAAKRKTPAKRPAASAATTNASVGETRDTSPAPHDGISYHPANDIDHR